MKSIERAYISDPHIDDDDKERFEAFKDVLLSSDHVVGVGDMFQLHAFPWQSLVRSRYATLLPLMRQNLTLLIGNHDTADDYKKVEQPFWHRLAYEDRYIGGGLDILATHGHQMDSSASRMERVMRVDVVRRVMPFLKKVEKTLIHTLPSRRLEAYYRSWNEEQKDGFDILKDHVRQWGIAGHTHIAELDIRRRYLNLGQFPYTWGSVSGGEISLRFG